VRRPEEVPFGLFGLTGANTLSELGPEAMATEKMLKKSPPFTTTYWMAGSAPVGE
jgi:hypothetical protein